MFIKEPVKRIKLEMRELPLDSRNPIRARFLFARCALFGPPDAKADLDWCRIDTGAAITVIPQRFWEPHHLNGRIHWLTPEGEERSVNGLGGARIRSRLGYVDFWLMDRNHRLLQWIVAECTYDRDDGRELPYALYGLGGGSMKNSGLCINFAEGQDAHAWFVRP